MNRQFEPKSGFTPVAVVELKHSISAIGAFDTLARHGYLSIAITSLPDNEKGGADLHRLLG